MAPTSTPATAYLPDGNHIFFYDSGAPDSTDYTTAVFIHGFVFHASKIFQSLLHTSQPCI